MLYPITLSLHSTLRWLIVIVGLMAVARAIYGWRGGRPWLRLDDRLGGLFTTILDVQLLVGSTLYIFLSPLTRAAFQNVAAAMGNSVLRFFFVEHMPAMVVAIVLAHVGRALSQRAATDTAKHKRAAVYFTLAMLAIVIAIPWPFLVYGRDLNPFRFFFGG